MQTKRIFIIAGEASGDALGAGLIAALHDNNIEWSGVGGEQMQEAGLSSIFPIADIALMGFAEIVPHAWRLMRRIQQTCAAISQFHPDIIITIDSPGFNLRVIEWAHKSYGDAVKYIHYVAPTVWAYKPHRAAKFAKLFNHLLVILPFEPPYFAAHGLPTTFIGHPLAYSLASPLPYQPWNEGEELRLLLLAGSRAGEVQQMLPIFLSALKLMQQYFPKISVNLVVNDLSRPHVEKLLQGFDGVASLRLVRAGVAFAGAHIALTKNGTVTLELAKAGVPMVTCYRVSNITAFIMRKMLKIPFVNLLNIINRRMIIPELLQQNCTAEKLCEAITKLAKNPAMAERQVQLNLRALSKMQPPADESSAQLAANVVKSYFLRSGNSKAGDATNTVI